MHIRIIWAVLLLTITSNAYAERFTILDFEVVSNRYGQDTVHSGENFTFGDLFANTVQIGDNNFYDDVELRLRRDLQLNPLGTGGPSLGTLSMDGFVDLNLLDGTGNLNDIIGILPMQLDLTPFGQSSPLGIHMATENGQLLPSYDLFGAVINKRFVTLENGDLVNSHDPGTGATYIWMPMIFNEGQSLSGLTINDFKYDAVLGLDQEFIVTDIPNNAVPEPGPVVTVALTLLLFGVVRFLKSRKAASASA